MLVQVDDLKGRNAMMNVDALWMENGIVLVWEWGVKDGEEVPVNYTQLPDAIPNWKREISGYALEGSPPSVCRRLGHARKRFSTSSRVR